MNKKYTQFIDDFRSSDNQKLQEIGAHFYSVFCIAENSPAEDLLTNVRNIEEEISTYFPPRFIEKYNLLKEKENKLQNSNDTEDKAQFQEVFLKLKDTWKLLMDFLPFLFMKSVNRIGKESLLEVGKEDFDSAFSIYKRVFHENDNSQLEKDKCELTIFMIKLFRNLSVANKIDKKFVLWPLLLKENTFINLFPLRFDAIITLFSLLGEEVIADVTSQQESEKLTNMIILLKWAFLDIINCIMPIFKNFYLVYVLSLDLTNYNVEGIALAGTGTDNLKTVNFTLKKGSQPDNNSFQECNMYLINRQMEKSVLDSIRDSHIILTPDDYMNMTPLMLYTSFTESTPKKDKNLPKNPKKEIFVFHGYNNNSEKEIKFLKFLEFSGERVTRLILSKKLEYAKLFEEYELFAKNLGDYHADIKKIFHKATLTTDITNSENFSFVFLKTWELSLGHIASLLRIDEYDSEARLKETMEEKNERIKFIEKLFVSPKEEMYLDEFLHTNKRGFILIGKSGMGKSNLLCASFLKQRRRRELNLFIDARRLESIDIKESLRESIAKRINEDWNLKDFDEFLRSNKKKLTVFIDAVNEYNNVGGATGLLEKICDLIEDSNIFENIKIVASCRNEIWDQYKKRIGVTSSILNKEYFFTLNGDAIFLSGFEETQSRARLYSSYQKYYKLQPESYKDLSTTVKELIQQPFMMGFIAEIYSQKYKEEPASPDLPISRTIPATLDYFRLFHLLTERKKEDAKRLLREYSDEDFFDTQFNNCLFNFTLILYNKITEPLPGDEKQEKDDRSDSLKNDYLNKHPEFNQFFKKINPYDETTIFSTIIQMNLIERIFVDESDYWGKINSGRAYKFFHDQYTQFWLAAVFNKIILGSLDSSRLKSDKPFFDKLINKIEDILEKSTNSPVLSGGLYHWLYNNILDQKGNLNDCLTILFNRLLEKDSNVINYFIGSFLHWLIGVKIISAEKLIHELVKNGQQKLRICFYDHILQIWPEIEPDTFQKILSEESDEEILKRIADIFVNLFTLESATDVLGFLDKALLDYKSLKSSFQNKIKNWWERDFRFSVLFTIQSFLCNYNDSNRLLILNNFLKNKYNWVFNLIIDKKARFIRGTIKNKLYSNLKKAGIHQWEQAVSSQARNDKFFELDRGIIQRDVLRNFYKYCAAFHNNEFEKFSLDIHSEYMTMTFAMLKYRNRSIIGYVATLILVGVLRKQIHKLNEIIDEIIELHSTPALLYSVSIVHMVAKLEPHTAGDLLEIVHKKLLPQMINNLGKGEEKYNISSFFVIGASDIEKHWEKSKQIFAETVDYLTNINDKSKIDDYGEMLVESVFPPDIKVGFKLCDYLLKNKLHENELWHDFTFKFLAGMLSRSPKTLKRLLDDNMIHENIIKQVYPFLTEDIKKFGSKVSYQHAWNNLMVLGFMENKQISYLLIKFLLSALAKSNNIDEASTIMPELVAEAIRRFIMKPDEHQLALASLTVPESL